MVALGSLTPLIRSWLLAAFRSNPNPSPSCRMVLIRTTAETVASYCDPGLLMTSTFCTSSERICFSSFISLSFLPFIYMTGLPFPSTSSPSPFEIIPGTLPNISRTVPEFPSTVPWISVTMELAVTLVFTIIPVATAPSSRAESSFRIMTISSEGVRYTVS